ncbi:hypothetical protein [Nocardia mexicana]|uniref:hypothetical protein n=1 Tax=Nocardia mexicana TaxID=279262 RepID=UPI00082E1DE3|nr:hypothetical protein [Nocardia mexicana]
MSANQTSSEPADVGERASNSGGYSWEIAHNGAVVEFGVVGLGEEHPWTGHINTGDEYLQAGAELFGQVCVYAADESRDAIIEARADGRPAPEPVTSVTVRLRDSTGTDLMSMTARLDDKPVTADDVTAYLDMMAAAAERDAYLRDHREPDDDTYTWSTEPPHSMQPGAVVEMPPSLDVRDPGQLLIDDLYEEAADLRDTVVDPDHCRRKLFQAEQCLADAQRHERHVAATAEVDALDAASERVARCARRVTVWSTRLADSTEIYLQAAALEAEAAHLSRHTSPHTTISYGTT